MLRRNPTVGTPESDSATRHPEGSRGSRLKVPLRLVFSVPMVLQIMLAVGLTGWLSFQNGQRAVNDLAVRLSLEVASRTQEHFQSFTQLSHLFLEVNSAAVQAGTLNPANFETLERYFWYQTQVSRRVTTIYYGGEDGRFLLVNRENPKEPRLYIRDESTQFRREIHRLDDLGQRLILLKTDNYDPRTRPWYQAAVQAGKPTWSSVYQFTASPVLGITPAMPIYSDGGKLWGVLAVDITLSQISDFLRSLKIGKSGQAFIVEAGGEIVATSTQEFPFSPTPSGQQRLFAYQSTNLLIRSAAEHLHQQFGRLNQIQAPLQLTFKVNQKRQFVTAMPLRDGRGLDWLMVVVIPEADFMDRIDANTQATVALCLLALTLALIMSLLTSRWLAKPIHQLSELAKTLAARAGAVDFVSQELKTTVETVAVEEVNVLAESFSQMTDQLRESFAAKEKVTWELEQRVEERTASLRSAEAELRALFAAMSELIFVKDREGHYLKIAPTNPALLYKPAGEVIGKTLHEIFPKPVADAFLGYIHEALNAHTTVNVEYNLNLGNAETWFAASISPLSEDTVIWVARDITQRKQVEAALRQSEQQLLQQSAVLVELAKNQALYRGDLKAAIQEIVEAAAHTLAVERVGVWLYDETRTKLECLIRYERSTGRYTLGEELIVTEYPIYFQALELDRMIAAHDACHDARTREFADTYFASMGVVSTLDAPIRLAGRIVGVICLEMVGQMRRGTWEEQNFVASLADLASLAIEAKERQRTEMALRQAEEKYRSIFENAVEGIFQTTPGGRFLSANPALARIYGYSSPAELMANLTDIQNQVYVEANRRHEFVRLVAQYGQVVGFESQVYRQDRSIIWISENARAVKDAKGELLYYEGILEEISDRKLFESAMQMALEAAKAASTAKSAFLANMSHELRTPLNAIIGYREILQEEAGDFGYEEVVPDLEKIRAAGKHLLSLIDDILDISKIEAGRMDVYWETFGLKPLIEEVVSVVGSLVQNNNNILKLEGAGELGAMHSDAKKVRQILLNLLSNATKFTRDGVITLSIERVPFATVQNRLCRDSTLCLDNPSEILIFRVTDTGIGMTPEQLQHIFQPFMQGDASTTRKYGGTGLGLAISQRFCEMLGGKIEVESQLKVGSVFTVLLPAEPGKEGN